MDILTNIRNLARERNIPLYKIEEDLGFGNNTIRKWNKHSPSVDKVLMVAEYLDCSIDDILGIKKESAENGLDDQLIRLLVSLPEDKVQRLRDFLAGLISS